MSKNAFVLSEQNCGPLSVTNISGILNRAKILDKNSITSSESITESIITIILLF